MAITGRALVEQLHEQVNEISVQQLHAKLAEDPQTIVIDIRETQETIAGTITNALLIPRGILETNIDNHPLLMQRFSSLDKLAEQPIYLLCRSGVRSVLSALSLEWMGFTQVYSVAGGFVAWQAEGYPVGVGSE